MSNEGYRHEENQHPTIQTNQIHTCIHISVKILTESYFLGVYMLFL